MKYLTQLTGNKCVEMHGVRLYILVFFLSFLYFSSGISRSTLFFYDEARNSGCAREMAERHDLVVPTFNYELRSDKPPLHYFFIMASYSVFGVNEFSSRFFSAVFGALTILITFYFVRKYFGTKEAFYTVLILLASLNFSLEFHLAVPDPYLIFFMTAANFAFFDFYRKGKITTLILMYVCTGLAMLTKGPVAPGLIAIPGFVFLIIKKEFNLGTIKRFKLIEGSLIVLAIFMPWFIKVGLATNWEWQREFLLEQNLGRLTEKMEGHGGFIGLTVVYVFMAFLPFALFIIQSFREAFRQIKENVSTSAHKRRIDFLLFATIVTFVVVLFFTVSVTKLPNYPMPAYPYIALIIASYLTSAKIRNLNLLLIIYLLICLVMPFLLFYLLKLVSETTLFFNLIWLFVIICAGAILAIILWFRYRNFQNVFISLSLSWIIASLVLFIWILPVVSKQNPVNQAIQLMDKSKEVAYYRRFNSSFPFYLRKPILRLSTLEEIDHFFKKYPDGYLITATQFKQELDSLSLKEIFIGKDLFEPPVTIVYERE